MSSESQPEISIVGTSTNRYAVSLGRRDRGRSDVGRTARAQGSGGLHQGGSGGQHIINQQAGDSADAGPPSRLHLHRALEVVGALPVVEPGLVGNPSPKPQRR